ncbi:MAG: Rrf2 family transcriptional regulator [Phycisphaerales bacterium]|nr:MAG: Rrf2 family transcriptional regulator [Phycisphaerales bacterium]
MLSTATLYALRAMVCLAEHPGEPLTSKQIADLLQTRSDYLAKVLSTLTRAGLINSRRGRRGGFCLGKSAENITLLEILRTTQELERIENCPLTGHESDGQPCLLRRVINDAITDVEQRLDGVTLAQSLQPTPFAAPANDLDDRLASNGACCGTHN